MPEKRPAARTGERPTGARPFTARSVVASTLLGVQPPRLPARHLVRAGELFGVAEGTIRVALSRMVAAGELRTDDGWYRLDGPLLIRQMRQDQSRNPVVVAWDGDWELAVVDLDRRPAAARGDLRAAMRSLRLAEIREGVWLRPANLDPGRLHTAQAVVDDQCRRLVARLPDGDSPAGLAGDLWPLEAWADEARRLRTEMADTVGALEGGDTGRLADSFVLAAAVLRHLLADPLLPPVMLPRDWPGAELRREYERYEAGYQALWRAEFRDLR